MTKLDLLVLSDNLFVLSHSQTFLKQESDCFRTVRMFREWAYTKKYVFFCLLNQFVL